MASNAAKLVAEVVFADEKAVAALNNTAKAAGRAAMTVQEFEASIAGMITAREAQTGRTLTQIEELQYAINKLKVVAAQPGADKGAYSAAIEKLTFQLDELYVAEERVAQAARQTAAAEREAAAAERERIREARKRPFDPEFERRLAHMREEQKGYRLARMQSRAVSFEMHHMTAALLGLSMVMATFGGEADKSTGKVKHLKESLHEGTQAGLGMAFGMMFLGPKMAALAGPVGIAVMAITSLMSYLRDASKALKEAEETGLKSFAGSLQTLSAEGRERMTVTFDREIKRLEEQREKLMEVRRMGTTAYGADAGGPKPLPGMEQRVKEINEQVALYEKFRDKAKEVNEQEEALLKYNRLISDLIRDSGETIARNVQRQKELSTEIESGLNTRTNEVLKADELLARVDELVRLEAQRKRDLRSSADIAKDNTKEAELWRELGHATLGDVVRMKQAEAELTRDIKEKLQIEIEIHGLYQKAAAERTAILEHQKELGAATTIDVVKALQAEMRLVDTEEERLAVLLKIKGVLDKEQDDRDAAVKERQSDMQRVIDAELELRKSAEKSATEAIVNEYDKREEVERQRHRDEMNRLELLQQAAENKALAQMALDNEVALHKRNLAQITFDHWLELEDARVESIQGDVARIEEKYKLELDLVDRMHIGRAEKARRTAALTMQYNTEMFDAEMRHLQELNNMVGMLGANMADAFDPNSADFIAKVTRMIQSVIQLTQAIKAMKAAQASADAIDSTLGFLGLFGAGFGILGALKSLFGFQKGGYTGEAGGIVHPREVVFEQGITEPYKAQLMALRAGLQQGMGWGAATAAAGGGTSLNTEAIVAALERLHGAVTGIEVRPQLVVEQVLDGQVFLDRHYDSWEMNRQYKRGER